MGKNCLRNQSNQPNSSIFSMGVYCFPQLLFVCVHCVWLCSPTPPPISCQIPPGCLSPGGSGVDMSEEGGSIRRGKQEFRSATNSQTTSTAPPPRQLAAEPWRGGRDLVAGEVEGEILEMRGGPEEPEHQQPRGRGPPLLRHPDKN